MTSIKRLGILSAGICMLLMWSGNVLAEDGQFSECYIEYQIKNVAQPGKHTDTDLFTKTLTACVRDLEDCHRRSIAIIRAKESRFVPEGEDEVPDLNSIRVSEYQIEGHCSQLDE